MKRLILFALISLGSLAMAQDFTPVSELNSTKDLKAEIIKIATFYKGQGDPDFKIQKTLDPYVEKLLEVNPQKPIAQRIDKLASRWKQVWGPYKYNSDDRGVDPTLDPDGIYQVVFKDGYYWNVGRSLSKRTGKLRRITLLRGIFNIAGSDRPDDIDVNFTRLKSLKPKFLVEGQPLTDLAELAEVNNLHGMRTSLPNFFVRRFFTGGTLIEVYTDDELRLAYGTDKKNRLNKYLYVMVKVQ